VEKQVERERERERERFKCDVEEVLKPIWPKQHPIHYNDDGLLLGAFHTNPTLPEAKEETLYRSRKWNVAALSLSIHLLGYVCTGV